MIEEDGEVFVDTVSAQIDETRIQAELAMEAHDRRNWIGGSDAPVILGLTSWKTPFELYLEKIGEREQADLSEVERVQWGIVLEDVVASMYMRKTGKKVRRMNQRKTTNEYGFPQAAQVDRMIVGERIPLEIKTTDASNRSQWGEEGSPDIAVHYYPQVQQQILLTGVRSAEVAVLFGGNRLITYLVPRDQGFIDNMIEAERNFWTAVQTRNPPDPISVDEASIRWSRGQPSPAYGPPELGVQAALYDSISEDIKRLDEERDRVKLRLMAVLTDASDTLMVDGVAVCSWKNQSRKSIDTAKLKDEYPDAARDCEKLSEFRVFRTLKGATAFRGL
jgi:putative phage-type endonuclease